MPAPETLDQAEFAKRLGISDRAVRKLHDHGLPRLDDGRYPWPEARHWYVAFKQAERERRRGGGEKLDLQQEQARKTRIQAEKAELELGQLLKVLFHVRDIEPMVRGPLEQVDAALRNAPARYAADLAAAAGVTVPVAMRLLEDVVERIRTDLRTARRSDDRDVA